MAICHSNAHWMKQAKTTCAQQLRCLVYGFGAPEIARLDRLFPLHRACFDECWLFALYNTWKALNRGSLAGLGHILIQYSSVRRNVSQAHFHCHRRLVSVPWRRAILSRFQNLVDVPGSSVPPVVAAHMRCDESCLFR